MCSDLFYLVRSDLFYLVCSDFVGLSIPPLCVQIILLCVFRFILLCVQILLPFNLFRFSAPNIPAAIHLAVRIVLLIFVDRNLKKENNKKFKGCDSSFEVNIFQILSYHFFIFNAFCFILDNNLYETVVTCI